MKKNIKTKIITLLSILSIGAFSLGVTFVNNTVETKAENGESVVVRTDFDMEDGATIRVFDPMGIRFSASLSESKYKAIVTDGEVNDNVQVGMIIVPETYFNDFDAQKETKGGKTDYYDYFKNVKGKMIDLPFDGYQIVLNDETGRYNYNGAIVGIKENNLELVYQAVGYINTNGSYEYTELSSARSVTQVAKMALVDNEEGRPTVAQAEAIGSLYGIEYHQLNIPEGFTVTDSQGEKLLSDSRLLEDESLTIEFNYGYNVKAVLQANGETIATAVGSGKLLYPVTGDVEFTCTTSAVTYKYKGTLNSTSTAVSGQEMTLDTDGFLKLPEDVKWGHSQIVTWQDGEVSQRIVTLEMKVEDLKKGFLRLGVAFGQEDGGEKKTSIIAIDKFTDNGDNTYTFSFSTDYCSSVPSDYTITKPENGMIELTFVSKGSSGSPTRTISVYLNGELVDNVTTNRGQDSRMYMWFDTRNNSEATAYRVNYLLSNGYGVLEE